MKRKRPNVKLLNLPSSAQFKEIITHVRKSNSRWHDDAADLIEGLAYSGMRVAEAAEVTWANVNLETGQMDVLGTKTRSSKRTIPLIPAMLDLLSRIEKADTRVFKAKSALTSLAKACAAVGVKKMTQHDLRHLFATACIEAGVDIPTFSRWLGHSDGGALAMKTYGHLRPMHSAEAAAKVRF